MEKQEVTELKVIASHETETKQRKAKQQKDPNHIAFFKLKSKDNTREYTIGEFNLPKN